MKRMISEISERTALRRSLQLLVVLAVSLAQAVQLHYSTVLGIRNVLSLSWQLMLLNAALLLWLNLLLKLIFQRWYLALYVSSGLCTLWCVVNFFVMKFHGSPLLFSEFANFGTAMNVIDGYRFAWERRLTWLVLFGLICAAGATVLLLCRKRGARFFSWREFGLSAAAFVGMSVLLYMSLFVWKKPKPRTTISWTWTEGVYGYGYPTVIVEDVDRAISSVLKPEGYDAAKLDAVSVPDSAELPQTLPDIVVILNETYYDLSDYLPITTDADYMAGFYGHKGAVYGRVMTPNVGGGTNNTEYELLTSNSMHLLSGYAPFNYINMSNDEGNLARYLGALGYRSVALHCEPGSNYSRNKAYPSMGFDEVWLGYSNFTINHYGNRRSLDADNYRDMISYAEALGDGPRLSYLLTFQNHGGWETNDESCDTVHIDQDYGDMTDDLNEYLTSIQMASSAFDELIAYYEQSDRPTIVCMLGDHCPSFLPNLEYGGSRPGGKTIAEQSTPYVLWSNYGLEFPTENMDYISMTDLIPILLRSAGIPTSAYQSYLLDLHERLPVRTTKDGSLDREGNYCKLSEQPDYPMAELYYMLEYNNLKHGSDYRRELFVLPGTE